MQELRHGELGAHGDDVAFLAVVAAAPTRVALQVLSHRIHRRLLGSEHRLAGALVTDRPDQRDALGNAERDIEGDHRLPRPAPLQQVSASARVSSLEQRSQLLGADIAVQTEVVRSASRPSTGCLMRGGVVLDRRICSRLDQIAHHGIRHFARGRDCSLSLA